MMAAFLDHRARRGPRSSPAHPPLLCGRDDSFPGLRPGLCWRVLTAR